MPLDHYVTLGRSGLRVSPFALGAMTFGEDPGAARHQRRGIREDPRRPTWISAATSSTPPTSIPTATRRRSSATGSPRIPAGASTSCWRRSSSATSFPATRTAAARAAHRSSPNSHETLRRLQYRLSRPVLAAQLGSAHPDRGNDAHPRRPGPGGQDPLHRVLQHPGLGHRAGADHGAVARLDPADRAAGRVLAAGPHRRG